MKRTISLLAVWFLFIALTGCTAGSMLHLNEPARSQLSIDVANLLDPREIPYETQEQSGITVSYNLFYAKERAFSGYRLTLILRNNMDRAEVLVPDVILRDARGLILQPDTYESFMSRAAAMARTPVPPIPETRGVYGAGYYHQGTITSPSGQTHTYSGTTTPMLSPYQGLATGFNQGLALGIAAGMAAERKAGHLMLQWGGRYWLKERDTVPPKSAVAGALFFSSPAPENLPLSVTMNLLSPQRPYLRRFEFKTVASPR